jgi:hypothetical protein
MEDPLLREVCGWHLKNLSADMFKDVVRSVPENCIGLRREEYCQLFERANVEETRAQLQKELEDLCGQDSIDWCPVVLGSPRLLYDGLCEIKIELNIEARRWESFRSFDAFIISPVALGSPALLMQMQNASESSGYVIVNLYQFCFILSHRGRFSGGLCLQ